ncbi:hypothetical protein PFNF54_03466 [Plasmodium falciparum NF54]|uniref:Uncharacterized protein n=1 Tax=Plasmodium falciparum (isolate NF54) TaxID=5843 RepID=W7KDY1_PLAFO|nr:hypothetical protein PFNF54_03466 [Plasmodium falciparum NF54]
MKVKIGSFENFLERLNNIKEEDIIINDENTEEMFSSFLITFYKENEGRYTIQEQEYINNLLNILINKIRDNKNGQDNVVELFFVLIKIKELEKYIIECDIIKYFLSFLLYDPQVIKKRKHLIIEIIIHMFLKNISIIKDFIKQNIIDILNNILKSIYNNIKCDHYDYYCINLLKIFYYIIQDKNIVNLENNFFSYPKNTSYIIEHEKNNNILIFYKYINNIINKINDVIKQNMSCKDSANIHILNNNDQLNYHFKYFLSILLCVIKSIITRIFQGKNNIQDSPSDDDKREEVYEEIIKLVNVTFEFVVNIIDKQKETSPEEHVLLHREEENLLLKFVNLYKEDIKKFERIFENVATFYNKKDNMELQNYYDYLRENKGIE